MTKTRDLSDFLIEGGADLPLGKPHIVPGVLYPAVEGKDINGTDIDTSHGSTYTYGELHTDGRKYYYTDIKGSKPIKDPRIGGHFGSQRHTFRSVQLLEQETATHGKNVYSIDGREWIRAVGNGVQIYNSSVGQYVFGDDYGFYEVTGYFTDVNLRHATRNLTNKGFVAFVDGNQVGASHRGDYETTVNTPLGGRYLDRSSLVNLSLGQTLGIHTLKISLPNSDDSFQAYGIELIAQDTTSTENRSKIQIPSQDVVSHGKKFTVSGTPHYNPFNNQTIGDNISHGKNTTGWTTYDSTLDTATSLGLDAWVDSGNYYRPVNGGRVIKWVDSSGNIKTSVNMMPPSAKAIGSHSGNSGPHETAWTSTYRPVFSSGAIDHSQAEVAKIFHYRDFGNGGANAGTGGANYADASMLSATTDDIAYVMDDGLSSLSASGSERATKSDAFGDDVHRLGGYSKYCYLTFIGTGISFPETYAWNASEANDETTQFSKQLVQNLPYGTHIIQLQRESNGGNNDGVVKIDGVSVLTNVKNPLFSQISIHQPKRPPIPEGACVLADYMLMADFVAQSTTVVETEISKGVRVVSGSRDHFIDGTSTFGGAGIEMSSARGFQGVYGLRSGVAQTAQLPFFGTRFLMGMEDTSVAHELTINGTSVTEDVYDCSTTTGMDLKGIPTANVATLGVNTAKVTMHGSNAGYRFWGTHVDSPIHTSHHYQTFETPFLHELVGGDRNMEQTNLIVSPDGKSWDEVTRDVSYLGNMRIVAEIDSSDHTSNSYVVLDEWRGKTNERDLFNKDFAIAYDRLICLVSGQYEISFGTLVTSSLSGSAYGEIQKNGTKMVEFRLEDASYSQPSVDIITSLIRGDYIQIISSMYDHTNAFFHIKKI